jgi:hypothetical protein
VTGGGAEASTAPPAQHGACAQWCSLDAGSGTVPGAAFAAGARDAVQRSRGDVMADAFAYVTTGATRCIAAATRTSAKCAGRFISDILAAARSLT